MEVTKKITDHVQNVCKIGQGAKCCKYLVMGTKGFECVKVNPINKNILDAHWSINNHVAQGDNCPGVSDHAILNQTPSEVV